MDSEVPLAVVAEYDGAMQVTALVLRPLNSDEVGNGFWVKRELENGVARISWVRK